MSDNSANRRNPKGPGLLLATGDLPDGGATAMRVGLIAKTIASGGEPIEIALLHATSKSPVSGNEDIIGAIADIRYRYLSGRTVRPSSFFCASKDTLTGILGFLRQVMLHRKKPSFVIFYTPKFWKMIIPILATRTRGIPIFVEACEVWSTNPAKDNKSLNRKFFAIGDRWLENLIPKIASGVIPISMPISRFYSELGMPLERHFHLPILVDTGVYENISNSLVDALRSKDYILSTGSLAEKNGIQYMIRAFEDIAKEYLDLYMVFTGGANEGTKKNILRYLRDKGLRSRIIFTGFLERDQLIWVYQNARGLLCCRSNSIYANYGFPTKLGEYLASGSPVIVTRVGDVDKYLIDEETAYLAESENTASISAAIRKLLLDRHKAKSVGDNGRKVAKKHFYYKVYSYALVKFLREYSR